MSQMNAQFNSTSFLPAPKKSVCNRPDQSREQQKEKSPMSTSRIAEKEMRETLLVSTHFTYKKPRAANHI